MEEYKLDDSFTSESSEYDLTLIVDGHKIRVWKVVLCVASPVFRAMLQSQFKEKDQAEVNLPGKKYKDFVEFLSCFYPDRLERVTNDSVYRILPLAVEYQVKVLEKECQRRLVKLVKTRHLPDAVQIYRHLQLAELYKLEDLRKICISAASDLKLSQMETAAAEHPIPENILVQIHHLARRKQELNKMDDDRLAKKNHSKSASYISFIEQEADLSWYPENHRITRAARLWYRYYQNNEELLRNIITSIESMKVDDAIKEECELLPDTIKQRLGVDYNKN
ncbi:TD and POZ domain-containing protein 3-like [Mercenaria mercenaria]|uniref:TD and POZ domain-containing protein 3-like n=1 Tax=Mercenaria mercenaria TaxID=6596 RepID=UPI00234E7133|nr:TD and POZ domain-containing protein 3-like [Mercenaria mercenaria]